MAIIRPRIYNIAMSTEEEIRKLGVLQEAMSDDIEKILEALSLQQENIKKIPKIAERVEKIESDLIMVKMATSGVSGDLKLLKIRTEKLDGIIDELKDIQARTSKLETINS